MKKPVLFAIIKNQTHIGNISSFNPKLALLNYLKDSKLPIFDKNLLKKYKVVKAIKNVHY